MGTKWGEEPGCDGSVSLGGGPLFDFTLNWTNSASSPPSLPSAPAVLRAPWFCPHPPTRGDGRVVVLLQIQKHPQTRQNQIKPESLKLCSSVWSGGSEGGAAPHEGRHPLPPSLLVAMVMQVEAGAAVTPLTCSSVAGTNRVTLHPGWWSAHHGGSPQVPAPGGGLVLPICPRCHLGPRRTAGRGWD